MIPKRKKSAAATSGSARNQDQTQDEDIIEVFTMSDTSTRQQVLKIIDRATLITCGSCDQIGRSMRKFKDLPPRPQA